MMHLTLLYFQVLMVLMVLNYNSSVNFPFEKKLSDQNDGDLIFVSMTEKKANGNHILFYLNWVVIV